MTIAAITSYDTPESMKTSNEQLKETPNLSYVQKLANGDLEFHKKFLESLKEEFADSYVAYRFHIETNEPRTAAEFVHKIKYSLSYLGMNASFDFATRHQAFLQTGNTNLHAQFTQILVKVVNFLKTC